MMQALSTPKPILLVAVVSLLLSFTSVEAVAAPNPSQAVAQAEKAYAALSDAHGVLELIHSGFVDHYAGKGGAAWEKNYKAEHDTLVRLLKQIDTAHLSPQDARAVAVMRKTIADLDDSANSIAPSGNCQDATRRDLDFTALRQALYTCFADLSTLDFEGKKLGRSEALSLLGEIDDPARRKSLFLSFTPLWQAINGHDQPDSPYRREIAQAAADAAKHGSTLDDAAKTLAVPPAQLETWLEQILDTWRQTTGAPPVEPWDFRYQNAQADRELATAIPLAAMLPITQRYYADLGADLQQLRILYDLDPRPAKPPLASSDFVTHGRVARGAWQPSVAWVTASYSQGGLGPLNEFVHENGHAIHAMAVHTRPAFMDLGDAVFYEAFADVTSWDTYEPAWQQKYLGRTAPEPASLRNLFSGVILDVAWSLFEIRMLHHPSADPNAVWTEITSHYLGIIPHPELSWWAVRVQLVESPGYMVNYGLGAVITADIRQHIRESIGPFATGNPHWYPWLTQHLLRYGEEKATSHLLREFLGRPVSPRAVLDQLRRIAPVNK